MPFMHYSHISCPLQLRFLGDRREMLINIVWYVKSYDRTMSSTKERESRINVGLMSIFLSRGIRVWKCIRNDRLDEAILRSILSVIPLNRSYSRTSIIQSERYILFELLKLWIFEGETCVFIMIWASKIGSLRVWIIDILLLVDTVLNTEFK